MRQRGTPVIAIALTLVALPAAVRAGDAPTAPPPAPAAGSLSDLARRISLNRSAAGVGTGAIVISDATLAALAAGGTLTVAAPAAAPAGAGPTVSARSRRPADETTLRRQWRQRHRAQQRRVAAAEAQLGAADLELDALEDSYLATTGDPRREPPARLRLERARQRRQVLAERLRQERLELDRVVRDARAEGAEPGWFR